NTPTPWARCTAVFCATWPMPRWALRSSPRSGRMSRSRRCRSRSISFVRYGKRDCGSMRASSTAARTPATSSATLRIQTANESPRLRGLVQCCAANKPMSVDDFGHFMNALVWRHDLQPLVLGKGREQIVRVSLNARHRVCGAFVNVRGGAAIDQETQQLRPAIVAARVHQLLTLVDQREVEIGDNDSFARANRLVEQGAIGCHDRGEAAARDRADGAVRVLDDLRLLIRIEPGRRAD